MINDHEFKKIHKEAVVLTWTLPWDWCEGYGANQENHQSLVPVIQLRCEPVTF